MLKIFQGQHAAEGESIQKTPILSLGLELKADRVFVTVKPSAFDIGSVFLSTPCVQMIKSMFLLQLEYISCDQIMDDSVS